MKDIQLNLSFTNRGLRAFLAINTAFSFVFTGWYFLIPVLFYLCMTALAGHCFVKALWRLLKWKMLSRGKTIPTSNAQAV